MRSFLVILLLGFNIGAAAGALAAGSVKTRLTHGMWTALEDGGLLVDVCGAAFKPDGGPKGVDRPCIQAPSGKSLSPSALEAEWRKANELN